MKILIISSNRSGSTFLYETLAGYIAPEQSAWNHTAPDRLRFDECIKDTHSEEWDLQWNKDNVKACLKKTNWVIKLLVEDITEETTDLYLKLIRQCDIMVKLYRNGAERTISRLVAVGDNNYGPKGVDTDSVDINYELVKAQVHQTIETQTRLEVQPADIEVNYDELQYPRQIISLIMGLPQDKFVAMDERYSKNRMVFAVDKLVSIRDMMDRACDEFQHPRWQDMDWDRYLGKK